MEAAQRAAAAAEARNVMAAAADAGDDASEAAEADFQGAAVGAALLVFAWTRLAPFRLECFLSWPWLPRRESFGVPPCETALMLVGRF